MKASVHMITYNHEGFIAQALDSVLMQKVDFEYEIVIGEDCSTDHTRDIVVDYQKRHPGKIRPLLHRRNLGAKMNDVVTHQACRGQYVALLEGDDYWTSPHKLQKQVDFLDGHPECAICFHRVARHYEDGSREPDVFPPGQRKEMSSLEDLLPGNFIPTCSTMYRRGLFGPFPDWYFEVVAGDHVLHILNAQHGKIGFIDEVMGVYRIHSAGIWTRASHADRARTRIKMYTHVNAHLHSRYEALIGAIVAEHFGRLAVALFEGAGEEGSARSVVGDLLQEFHRWSSDPIVPDAWVAPVLSRIYAESFFASHRMQDRLTRRRCLVKATQLNPLFLRDLGAWSVMAEMVLGPGIAVRLRQGARALLPLFQRPRRRPQPG